jgi:ammonium transporter, Amt family
MNGCLTGLVAITAPCAAVDTWAACLIGVIAGWVYIGVSKLLIKCRFDDTVDAVPVHMGGGIWGLIASGLFTTGPRRLAMYGSDQNIGWFYEWGRGSGNFSLLGAQLVGVLFIFGWSFTVTGLFFVLLNYCGALRVSALEEEAGMDISIHKGACYDMSGVPNEETVADLHNSRHGGGKQYGIEQEYAQPKEEPAEENEA